MYNIIFLYSMQTIVSLREDLKLLHCDLICWNWNVAAAGVVCRLQKKARSMFKFTKSFTELIETIAPHVGNGKEIECGSGIGSASGSGSRRVSHTACDLSQQ